MIEKNNWYYKYIQDSQAIEQEASFKEKLIYTLMIWCILGFDYSFMKHISKKENLPVESISKVVENPENIKRIQEMIKQKDTNSVVKSMYDKAQKDADEIKKEKTKDFPLPAAKKPSTPKIVVDNKLVKVVLALEGSGSKDVSSKGAVGKMQIMPNTWEYINSKFFNGKYPFNKYKSNDYINMKFGKKYLEYLTQWLMSHKSNWEGKTDPYFLLFVAYNAGPTNVHKCDFNKENILKKLPSAYDYAVRGKNLMSVD